ncbi:MAG TPA: TlpA disulfide reductase family protein [Alphaproteobacteria bacterium]|nr:TlpA disulfide reductase family protein [Alphaproteobacteria bacterium]
MKAKFLVLLLAAAILAGAITYYQQLTPRNMDVLSEDKAPSGPQQFFPDIGFTMADGSTLHLRQLKEPIVLVHFWAAWCLPCQAEFPELLKYVAKANGRIALLAVSLDDRYTDSQKMLDKIGADIHAPHLYWAWDKGKSLSIYEFNTVKVPETIVVKRGVMADKIIGPAPWTDASPQ